MPFVLSFGGPFGFLILYTMCTVKHHRGRSAKPSVVITRMEVNVRASF